jgi:hypothetical protein
MGRSTGIDKRRTSRVVARSRSGLKEKEAKHQRLVKFLEEKFGLKDLDDYVPMSDHDELVRDAVIVWAGDSEALFSSTYAYNIWKSTPEGERFENDLSHKKHNLEHWERAVKAFVYQFRDLEKVSGPFFRGQSMRSGLPTDRMRSWSRDINEAISFSLSRPKIVGSNGQRDCPSIRTIVYQLREGKNKVSLAADEKIVISLCLIDGQAEGLDLNASYLEAGRQEVIDSLRRGETVYCLAKEGGEWDRTKLSLDPVKKHLATKILNKLPAEEVKTLQSQSLVKTAEEIVISKTGDDFLDLIKKTNDPAILKTWQLGVESLVKAVESYPSIAPAHYHSSEEEIIIHAGENVQRLEIPVADSIEELRGLNTKQITDLVATRALGIIKDT